MSKKAKQTSEQEQPAYVADLLLNGTTILEAPIREELAEMINDIPANCKYCVGAVGHNAATGVFSLRVDLC